MTPASDDAAPPPFPFPTLREPIGPLGTAGDDGASLPPAAPFHVAGRRAFVTAAEAAGALDVWSHPVRLAAGIAIHDAAVTDVREWPAGIERGLRVAGAAGTGDVAVVERIVVPRDGPFALLEWEAAAPVTLALSWRVDLRAALADSADEEPALRLRRDARGLVAARGGAATVVCAFSRAPERMTVTDVEADVEADAGGGVVVRAVLRLDAGEAARLAVLGGSGDPASASLRGALRAAERTRAVVAAWRGSAERLRSERLSLVAPDPEAGARLERAKARLASHVAEAPGVGRSMVAGYGRAGDGAWCAEFRTPESVRGAAAALAAGDPGPARDVLVFLGRHQSDGGRPPSRCALDGQVHHDAAATPLYLRLVARYLAWSGDVVTVQAEWPRVLAAVAALSAEAGARADDGANGEERAALAGLVPAAEAVGDAMTAAALRRTASGSPRFSRDVADVAAPGGAAAGSECPGGVVAAADGVLEVAEALLGAEPDAPRGRLVLRPRPPSSWRSFTVRSLVMGDAAVSVEYAAEGGTHRFRVRQDRGGAPVQLVLAPELRGRLRAARVDGAAAELEPVVAGDRVSVPVQLVLDHPRTLEVEVDGETGA